MGCAWDGSWCICMRLGWTVVVVMATARKPALSPSEGSTPAGGPTFRPGRGRVAGLTGLGRAWSAMPLGCFAARHPNGVSSPVVRIPQDPPPPSTLPVTKSCHKCPQDIWLPCLREARSAIANTDQAQLDLEEQRTFKS